MFTREGRKKRGDYILVAMLLAILTESAIQYIVYLRHPNERYKDYTCLDIRFQSQGYYPVVFLAFFFILLGLSLVLWRSFDLNSQERPQGWCGDAGTLDDWWDNGEEKPAKSDIWVT